MAPVVNAMTVDVEDYFHVSAFAHMVAPSEWDSFESRVCRNTGYRGRIGIYELFVPDDQMFDLISNGAFLNSLKAMANSQGMRTLRMDGLDKVKAGITTLEEVHRVSA